MGAFAMNFLAGKACEFFLKGGKALLERIDAAHHSLRRQVSEGVLDASEDRQRPKSREPASP
jgi:hypothetical protein